MWPLCDTLVIFAYEMRNKNAMNLAFYVPVYYGLLENDNMCESRERERERECARKWHPVKTAHQRYMKRRKLYHEMRFNIVNALKAAIWLSRVQLWWCNCRVESSGIVREGAWRCMKWRRMDQKISRKTHPHVEYFKQFYYMIQNDEWDGERERDWMKSFKQINSCSFFHGNLILLTFEAAMQWALCNTNSRKWIKGLLSTT